MREQSHGLDQRRGLGVSLAVAVVLLGVAGCGNSRDSSQGEETVPRIPPTSSPTTVTTSAPATTPASTAPPTNAPTAPPVTPFPTSATPPPTPASTSPPETEPPTTPAPITAPPTQAPTTHAPVTEHPLTQPLTTPPPITLPPGTAPPPTTVVVTPGEPALCTDAAVGAATGLLTVTDVSCHAGWAVGHDVTCPATQECEGVDVFHVTSSGWVHDGYFPAMCAEGLTASGMSIYTASAFATSFCGDPPGPTEIIRPASTGERVVQLQTALIALGYPIAADGTYGPRTEAAVRDYQARNGLEVDGIAGPRTQASLGIGPGGPPPDGSATTSPATEPPATMVTTTEPATTTTVVSAGDPAECTAAAVGDDIGRPVDVITACHAGWALGQIRSCGANAACPRADLFRMSETGWAFIRQVRYECAEDLHDAGMSAYTAAEFAEWCGVPNLPAVRLVIEPGTSGVVVEQLQVALVALGYDIAIDGTYGPGTEQAVRDFQTRTGLEVDGIAGPDTRELLGL